MFRAADLGTQLQELHEKLEWDVSSSVVDPGFLGHPDPDLGKKFTDPDPDPDPDPSSTIIFKSQNNGI